jgi:hypothetical protein
VPKGGRKSLMELKINRLSRKGRSSSTHPATRSRKAYKSGSGRKAPQERGEAPLPM